MTIASNEDWGCVAIVDDDVETTLALQEFLASKGFSAECFGSAEAFLATTQDRFAAILLDINLPGMWGSECGFELRRRGYAGPMIAISGNMDVWDAGDIHYLGFTCSLSKPIQPDQLISLLRKYLIKSGEALADAEAEGEWTEQRPDPEVVARSGSRYLKSGGGGRAKLGHGGDVTGE